MRSLSFGLLPVLLVVASSASAQPSSDSPPAPRVTVGTDIAAVSAYVWRGFVPVPSTSVQPSLFVKAGDLTMTAWSNFASRGPNGEAFTEQDITVDYGWTRGNAQMSVGYIWYAFPDLDGNQQSHELYAGITAPWRFSPSFRIYQDVGTGRGTYAQASVAHERPLYRTLRVTASASLGYNHEQWVAGSGWSDLVLGAKVTIPTPQPRVSLAPFLFYSQSLDAERFPSRMFGGLNISLR
jgi:hypothetical protein